MRLTLLLSFYYKLFIIISAWKGIFSKKYQKRLIFYWLTPPCIISKIICSECSQYVIFDIEW